MSPSKSSAHAIEWGPSKSSSNQASRLLRTALPTVVTKNTKKTYSKYKMDTALQPVRETE